MLVTFINNEDENDKYGPYKLDHLPAPGEIIGFVRDRSGDPTVYIVLNREYVFKAIHHQPEVNVYLDRSA